MKAKSFPFRFGLAAALIVAAGCGKKDGPAVNKAGDSSKPLAAITGYWFGELKVPGNSFPLGFDVLPEATASPNATMDSFDQGLRDWPATVRRDGNLVSLEVDLKGSGLAKFEGRLSEDGNELEGNWRQGPADLPLTLKRGVKAQAIRTATAPLELAPQEFEMSKAAARQLLGTWAGALNVGGKELRLEFTMTANTDGSCATTLKSLDQGGAPVPVKKTLLAQSEVTIEVPGIKGKYVGTFDPGGKIIDGTWMQGPANLPLVLEKQ